MTNTQIQIILRLVKAAQSLTSQLTEALGQLRQYVQSLINAQQPIDTLPRSLNLDHAKTVKCPRQSGFYRDFIVPLSGFYSHRAFREYVCERDPRI